MKVQISLQCVVSCVALAAVCDLADGAQIQLRQTRNELRPVDGTAVTYIADSGEQNSLGVTLRTTGREKYLKILDASIGITLSVDADCDILGAPAEERGGSQRATTPATIECPLTRLQALGIGNRYLFGASLDDKDDSAMLRLPRQIDTWLAGGSGGDMLFAGSGNDLICAGDFETFSPRAVPPNTRRGPDCRIFRSDIAEDTSHGLSRGGAGNDILYGTVGTDTLNGEAGNDMLYGLDDVDLLIGGRDTDWLYGGGGDDLLDQPPVQGVAGNQERQIVQGNDHLFGEGGNDTAGYRWVETPVSLFPHGALTSSGNDTFSGIENFELGQGDDAWAGNIGANAMSIKGYGGDDTIDVAGNGGMWGSDSVDCGDGQDRSRIDRQAADSSEVMLHVPIFNMIEDGHSNCEQVTAVH